ncbi:MAG: Na+/H+ antiporter NhaA [Phycisphaerae bacterium]
MEPNEQGQGRPTRERAPAADFILRPFREFARIQAAGGIVLIGATVIALVWSNSPWADTYKGLWQTAISIGVGEHTLTLPIVLWVNDLAMALFFLLVGVEIKHEILVGQLATARKAALPIVAAAGGMAIPGIVYVAVNVGHDTLHGWGVPVATDIAFALGVLTLLGPRVPVGLKVFLASLAIADDIGALVVIAVFYTEQLKLGYLLGAAGIIGFLAILNRLGFRHPAVFMLFGLPLWFMVHESGVHATIAGVALAMTIPARATIDAHQFLAEGRWSLAAVEREVSESDLIMTSARLLGAVHVMDSACSQVETPLQRVEHALHPWVAFLIIPAFALANAGLTVGASAGSSLVSPVSLGIVLGLVLGKPVGITLSSWLAVRVGLASLPSGVTWRHLLGAGCLGGIGFTMSLFIAHLAFERPVYIYQAKVGVLAASVIAGLVGWAVLARRTPSGSASPEHGPTP